MLRLAMQRTLLCICSLIFSYRYGWRLQLRTCGYDMRYLYLRFYLRGYFLQQQHAVLF